MNKEINIERLKRLFLYNASTGNFIRKVARGNRSAGSIANSKTDRGYITIEFDGVKYYGHRLAWAYVYGETPKHGIDHINGNITDNRICNLRIADQFVNMKNQKKKKNNKSGITGVYPVGDKWRALIMVDRKRIELGRFNDIRDAVQARKAAQEKYGFTMRHGI